MPDDTHNRSNTCLDIARLATEHYDAVFRFCAHRLGADRAADAAQETFLTAQRALRRFRGDSSITTWLFGIANNECRAIARRERLQPTQLEFDPEHTTDGEGRLVDRQLLKDALAGLSADHRDVVLLHELDGLTYEETAKVLGVPLGTVKSRLHHAFLNLKKSILEPEPNRI